MPFFRFCSDIILARLDFLTLCHGFEREHALDLIFRLLLKLAAERLLVHTGVGQILLHAHALVGQAHAKVVDQLIYARLYHDVWNLHLHLR